MTERVDIANLALSWIGEKQITSLDDETQQATQVQINYLPCRDATLEAHDWTFAIKRFVPAKNNTPPLYGAGAAFDVPSDILRVIAVERNNTYSQTFTPNINSEEQIDWQFERGQIICDEAVVYARGIMRVDEEGRFSPLFVHAFAAKLASLLAISLSASAEIQANMFGLYDNFIREAKSRDGIQGRNKRIRHRRLQKVR
jgi:hypothetical protein